MGIRDRMSIPGKLGQRAPRKLWVAVVLTVLMPGLGHLYCGRIRTGLWVWGAVLSVVIGALLLWARWLFVPLLPLGVGFVAWILLLRVLISDLSRFVEVQGVHFRLQPGNHWLLYSAVYLGLGLLPIFGTVLLVSSFLIGSVTVESPSMFPNQLPGDKLLFDRTAYLHRRPEPGEMVVVSWPPAGQLVSRVIATGGETVELRDGRPIVDGEHLNRVALSAMRVPRFAGQDARFLETLVGYLERLGEHEYLVTYRRDRPSALDPPPITLASDEVFVIGDCRDVALERHQGGKVPLSAVLGAPRYVWASFDPDGQSRTGRAGLVIH